MLLFISDLKVNLWQSSLLSIRTAQSIKNLLRKSDEIYKTPVKMVYYF